MAALLLCTAWAAQAQNLTVKVNDGTALTVQASLQAAIEASNVPLADITSIEISAGAFTTDDWEYLKSHKNDLSSLASFSITDGIASVADMPVVWTIKSTFNSSLTSVSIDASFALGNYTFYRCTALASVNLPKATSIGDGAFLGCTALTSISLPAATSVGGAFDGCTALTTVNLPVATTIVDEMFKGCAELSTVSMPAATSVGGYAFSGCTSLTSISLPEVTSIGESAFAGCEKLATVSLAKATEIGNRAFSSCKQLSSISLPEATKIYSSAFTGCEALVTVSMPKATSIDEYAFYNCKALTLLELGATPPTVGDAFQNCPSPRYLKLLAADGTPLTGDELTTAIAAYKADGSWDNNTSTWHGWSLMHVVAATANPAEAGTIAGAGQYKPGETATLTATPNKGYLFKQWDNGQTANPYSFEVSADVELEAQFEMDYTVYPLTVKVNATTLTDQASLGAAIMGCGIALKDITSIEITAGTFTYNDWQFLADIKDYLNSLESFTITNGIIRVADMPDLYVDQSCFSESLTTLSIDARFSIGGQAFNNCKKLSSIYLPKVTSIGDNAFGYCESLTSVDLPEVTIISWSAFRYCESLTTVNLPKATKIGNDAFDNCHSLTSVNLPKATSIGDHAFGYCESLTTVFLPAATSIGSTAFFACRALSSVSLPAVTGFGHQTFDYCYSLTLLELGVTPPTLSNFGTFIGCPSPRYLKLVDAEGNPLTGTALNDAIDAYKAVGDGNINDNLWYGWSINGQPNESLTVKVNGGAEITGPSLRAIFEVNNIEPANVTQLEVLSGSLLGYDAGYMRSSLTVLQKLTLTTATVLNLRLEHGSLQEVYAPQLQTIGERGTVALTTVSIPAAKMLDNEAFSYSTSLTFLELGATPPKVGTWAFNGCPSPRYLKLVDAEGNPLTGTALNDAIEAYKAVDDGNTSDNLWYGWSINDQPNESLTVKVNGGSEITGSSLRAIFEANNIEPANVTQLEVLSGSLLGYDAGYMRSSLTALQKLTLTTATELNLRLEHGSLQEVYAPQLEIVGNDVFNVCTALTTVNLPKATEIGDGAFDQCTALTTVNLPEATSIGWTAFEDCYSLTSVNLPKAINIGERAFAECSALTSVNLPKATEIGEAAFVQCESLTTVNMPEAINIGYDAFFNCVSLTTVRIPKAESIDISSFEGCYNLTFLELGATPPTGLDHQAFDDCASPRYLTVDVSTVDDYKAVKDDDDTDGMWYGWLINEQPPVQQIAVKVNGGAEITGSSLQAIIEASNIEPASVTQLEVLSGELLIFDALYMRNSLTALQRLTLTTATEYVLKLELRHGSLQELYAPQLETVGDGAFIGCSALTTVSLPKATLIGKSAFEECPALSTLELGATPPKVGWEWPFGKYFDLRSLTIVDADGNPLTGDELIGAIVRYRNDVGYSYGEWHGWSLEPLNTLIYTASEGGIIVGRAVQRLYYEQDGTTVIAVPADGYKFLRWSDDCTDNPRTDYEVRADLNVQALFEHLPFNLTYTAGVGGHIDGQLSQSVKQGENASTVKAVPAEGYKFLRWSDGRTDNPRTDTNVQADLSVEAVFIDASTIVYTLTYTASDGGSIKGTATQTVVEGESGTEVEAIANEGYRFVRWSDGLTTAKRTDTNVQKNISVTAEFVQEGSSEGGDNDGGDSTGLLDIHRESLTAYPNPTTGMLWVSVPEPVEGTAANVLVYNINGQLLQRIPAHGASAGSAASRLCIDLSGYPAGVYIIRVGNARAKVLKQ